MRRSGLAALVTCGALLVPATISTAAPKIPTVSIPTVSVPTVSVPAVSVPTVSVPTVSVPGITIPSVTTPSVTVGPVSTPQVTTPAITKPVVSAPPLPTPVRQTPTGDTAPAGSRPTGSPSGTSPTQSQGGTSQSRSAPNRPASAGRSAAGRTLGTASSGGRAGRSGAGRATGTANGAGTGQSAQAGSPGAGGTAARNGRATAAARAQSTGAAKSKATNGPFVRLVKELPTALLVALLAFGVIAAAMALNAYLQSRRARSLAGQRAALLSDVGVLQAALLPAVPESLGELEVSVAYRPAQGLAAGGDFFDVFSISTETTGIIIGDVSGHGRESLIHAALVRYTLRTLMGEGHRLPEVLARADRYLTGELGDGYATVVICRYDHGTGELMWAKAGHEPPIVAGHPDGDEAGASPLGFGLGGVWPEFSRALAPGERMCLFTDGLIEARRQGEQLGRAHLRSLVEQGMSAQELVTQIQSDGEECPDDLAAVVIRRASALTTVPATETDTRQPAAV